MCHLNQTFLSCALLIPLAQFSPQTLFACELRDTGRKRRLDSKQDFTERSSLMWSVKPGTYRLITLRRSRWRLASNHIDCLSRTTQPLPSVTDPLFESFTLR